MSKHIYVTVGTKSKDGIYRDANGVPSSVMNYRGKVGEGDDPESFQRMLAKKGMGVHVSGTLIKPGEFVGVDGSNFLVNYPKVFDELVGDSFSS